MHERQSQPVLNLHSCGFVRPRAVWHDGCSAGLAPMEEGGPKDDQGEVTELDHSSSFPARGFPNGVVRVSGRGLRSRPKSADFAIDLDVQADSSPVVYSETQGRESQSEKTGRGGTRPKNWAVGFKFTSVDGVEGTARPKGRSGER